MVQPTTEGPTDSADEIAHMRSVTLDLRQAALDARELALDGREAALDDRLDRGRAVTEAAERRDVAADTRDAVANKRDMTHTLEAFLQREDPPFGYGALDSAADDRRSSKGDRSDSATDRGTLTEQNADSSSGE
jgi:hypothetical protein